MKQIKQFRYYGKDKASNYPQLYNYYGTLIRGNLFSMHGGITHLGIQGYPGTKFYLNDSPLPITIGFTGIYELELGELGHIYSIRFDKQTIDDLYEQNASGGCLLIDIVYQGGL